MSSTSTDTASKRSLTLLLQRYKRYSSLYILLFPALFCLVVFSYYPKIDVLFKSFYRWIPGQLLEHIGFGNFRDAFSDPQFWSSFQLVGIILVANVVKLIPGIISAIVLHRLISEKGRYFYQVAFVIPMVVPGIVWMLVWKSFFDPDFGIFNKFLNATGLMGVLRWMDGTVEAPGFMPQMASTLEPVNNFMVMPFFGNTWGLFVAGAMALTLNRFRAPSNQKLKCYAILLAMTAFVPVWNSLGLWFHTGGVLLGLVIAVGLLIAAARALGTAWIVWAFIILGALVALWSQSFRIPLMLLTLLVLLELVRSRFDEFKAASIIKWFGAICLAAGAFIILFGSIWTEPTQQFQEGRPAWLGNEDLIIPTLIMWGFPWVYAVSVLIYLSGLQQISDDVYEAAQLDGLGPIGTIFRIELPLIMTQLRINLILMTISTLNSYESFLILLGPDGGPGGRGLVPGLMMFKVAFLEGKFGYACALGMVLFVIILLLTIIYNRYVKVDK